ncbi:MAG: hypothetical protein JXR07_09655 [Reichenbachiella sp.]
MNYFKTLLLGLFFILTLFGTKAATLVANNNPGAPTGTNVYTTLQAAINASSAGDVIYVVPSQVIYDDVTIDKSLTLLGAGFRPDKDLSIPSEVADISIEANDVRISGLVSANTWYMGWNQNTETYTNITIENCRFGRLRMSSTNNATISNLLVRNCIITATGGTYDAKAFDLYVTSNVIITNNLINTSCCSNSGIKATGVTFSYNIIRYHGDDGNVGNTFAEIDACLFEYNIFYGSTQKVPANSSNNTFNYNLSFANKGDHAFDQIGDANGNTGVGNVAGGDPEFANLPLGANWSNGYDISLGATSAADNIDGTGGIAGPTGGLTPWDPDGSLLPTIQSITLPSVIPVGDDLNVNIKGKGN